VEDARRHRLESAERMTKPLPKLSRFSDVGNRIRTLLFVVDRQ